MTACETRTPDADADADDGAVYLATREIPLRELAPFPGNARRGDVPAIRASLRRNGQYRSLIVRELADGTLVVLAGNHTLQALAAEGRTHARCEIVRCDDATARRINLADNRTAELGDYDHDALLALLTGLEQDYEGTGYTDTDFESLLADCSADLTGPADVEDDLPLPAPPADPVSKLGDLWILGGHRLLCGDSTEPADVQRVVDGCVLTFIHADPPYGMGKESDGVLNDNLYGPQLDAFQMRWWAAWLPALSANGSAYIWGNAPDLWRLWWVGGLSADPDLAVRNEIVWDKGSVLGMSSRGGHSYPPATERCLFLMRGQQALGNHNKEDYWEGYEPLRVWMCAQRDKAGWVNKDVNHVTKSQMAMHWFGRSQFTPITAAHYRSLQAAAAGRAFLLSYDELFDGLFAGVKQGGKQHHDKLYAQLCASRTVFDNTHDSMTDVWSFGRVTGDERFGHATPKPVAMVERAIKSSSRAGDVIGVPFGGSGPEFIAATKLGRRCVAIELEPCYVDVICRRFQQATGTLPVLESTGLPHDFTDAG